MQTILVTLVMWDHKMQHTRSTECLSQISDPGFLIASQTQTRSVQTVLEWSWTGLDGTRNDAVTCNSCGRQWWTLYDARAQKRPSHISLCFPQSTPLQSNVIFFTGSTNAHLSPLPSFPNDPSKPDFPERWRLSLFSTIGIFLWFVEPCYLKQKLCWVFSRVIKKRFSAVLVWWFWSEMCTLRVVHTANLLPVQKAFSQSQLIAQSPLIQ